MWRRIPTPVRADIMAEIHRPGPWQVLTDASNA